MPATKRQVQPTAVIKLPGRIKLTDEELCAASRLARLMRTKGWLATFMLAILDREAIETGDLAPEDIGKILSEITAARARILYLKENPDKRTTINRKPPATSHSAILSYFHHHLRLIDDPINPTFQWVVPDDEEEQFYQLLKQWRLEHPAPPKRRQIPAGRTQHDSDPDSD